MSNPDSSPFFRTTTGGKVIEAFAQEVEGKTIIVTSASKGGLGKRTCLALVLGHLACRTESNIAPIVDEVKYTGPESVKTLTPSSKTANATHPENARKLWELSGEIVRQTLEV